MTFEKDTSLDARVQAPLAPAKAYVPRISLEGAPLSQWSTRDDDEYGLGSHPASPFYTHPTTKSHERLKALSSTHLSAYETDLEAGSGRASREISRESKRTPTKDTMWPQREALVREAKQRKQARGCYPWNRLNSRQKLIAKILIALLVVGIGVILGVCISIAVHGTYYKSSNMQSPVGGSS